MTFTKFLRDGYLPCYQGACLALEPREHLHHTRRTLAVDVQVSEWQHGKLLSVCARELKSQAYMEQDHWVKWYLY